MTIRILLLTLLVSPLALAEQATVILKSNPFAQEHEQYVNSASRVFLVTGGCALAAAVGGNIWYRKSDRYQTFCNMIAGNAAAGQQRNRERAAREERERREEEARQAKQQKADAAARELKRKQDEAAALNKKRGEDREQLIEFMAQREGTPRGQCPGCEDMEPLFFLHLGSHHQACLGCIGLRLRSNMPCPIPGCAQHIQLSKNIAQLRAQLANDPNVRPEVQAPPANPAPAQLTKPC